MTESGEQGYDVQTSWYSARKAGYLMIATVPGLTITPFQPPQFIKMGAALITSHVHNWQPQRKPWSQEHIVQEHAIALGQAIDVSIWKNYRSTLNSYLLFVCMHNMPVKPTSDTLMLEVVCTVAWLVVKS